MTLTAETLDQLQGEPGWLRERRESALADFEKLPAPSKTDEEWRRTDVSRLDPNQFSKLEHLDGQKLVLPSALPKGVILEPLRLPAEKHRRLAEPRAARFALGRVRRLRGTVNGSPTEPSNPGWMSRFRSTAYSSGSSLVNGSMNPLTIIVSASARGMPRLIR